MAKIRFGTDGWRAIIADDFTFENVRKVTQAIADYLNARKPNTANRKPIIVVGYDRRFLSKEYAKATSEVLAANGIKALLVKEATPTPAISFAIKKRCLDGGIIITASHNPPSFNGLKFKTCHSISADEMTTDAIEKLIGKRKPKKVEFDTAVSKKKITFIDAGKDYVNFLKSYCDVKSIRKSNPKVLIDYMHGVAAGYIEAVLGKPLSGVKAIREGIDPLFGGVNPEPIPKNMELSSDYIKNKRFALGVAIDGDGDRIGALKPDGTYITSGQIISLILLHFLEDRNLRGKVVKTISGTTLIEKICKRYSLTMYEVPVGFKHISSLMLKENVLIGGEESGGIGFCGYIPERDGILSALLLMEMMAHRKKAISVIMKAIDKRYGKLYYDRLDIAYPYKEAKALTKRLKKNPPRNIVGRPVNRIKTYDGIKFILNNGDWLLLRFSGTEPLIRIYAEANSDKGVKGLLSAGKGLLRRK